MPTTIEIIVAAVESLRPHNKAGDMMIVSKAELTDILTVHLAELTSNSRKYEALSK